MALPRSKITCPFQILSLSASGTWRSGNGPDPISCRLHLPFLQTLGQKFRRLPKPRVARAGSTISKGAGGVR